MAAVHGVDRILLARVGVLLAVSWWALLRTYERLAHVKFQVILGLEDKLPVGLYKEEWQRLQDLNKFSAWSNLVEYRLIERILPMLGLVFTVVVIEAIAST